MYETDEYAITTKEWDGISHERTVHTRSGQERGVIISSFARSSGTSVHMKDKRKGIYFDIPCDGDYNIVLSESGTNNPLGVASIDFKYGLPLVTMIQKARAVKKVVLAAPRKGPLRNEIVYDPVDHPHKKLTQGPDKLPWEKVLLEECAEAAKNQGYDRLRLLSGFRSDYLVFGHELPMAVQQYDYLVKDDPEWEPLGPTGILYTDEEKKNVASMVTWVRNRKIYTLDEVKKKYPNTLPPGYYEKKLT